MGDTAVIDATGSPYRVTISHTTIDPAVIRLDSADAEILMDFQGTYAGTTTPAAIEIANGRLVMADASYLKDLTVTLSGGSLRIGENYYGSPDGVTRNYLENVTFDSGASRWAGNIVSTGLVRLLNGHTVSVGADATQTNNVSMSGAGFSGDGAVMLVAEDGLNRGVTLNVRTIGSGITVQTHSAGGGISTDDFQNAGRLIAEGQNLRVLADSSLTNLAGGEMIARNGGVLILDSASPLVNDGLIATETGGQVVLDGSYRSSTLSQITRSGGELALAGTIDNAGQTLFADDFDYLAAEVVGGTIASASGKTVTIKQVWGNDEARFDGVVLDTVVNLQKDEDLTIAAGGVDLTSRGRLNLGGEMSLSGVAITSSEGGGEIWMSGGSIYNGTFTIDQNVLLRAVTGGSVSTRARSDRYGLLTNLGGIIVEAGATLATGRIDNVAGIVVNEGGAYYAPIVGNLGSIQLNQATAVLSPDLLYNSSTRDEEESPFNIDKGVVVGQGSSLRLNTVPTFDSGVLIDVAGGKLWSSVDYDWLRTSANVTYSNGGESVYNGKIIERIEGFLFDDGVLRTGLGVGTKAFGGDFYSTTGASLRVGFGGVPDDESDPSRVYPWTAGYLQLDDVFVHGGLTVVDAGSANLSGDWQVDGPIILGEGSKLKMSGDFTSQSYMDQDIRGADGRVLLTDGTMDLSGGSFLLAPDQPEVHLGGYTLRDGRVDRGGADGASLVSAARQGVNTLVDVTLGDGIDLIVPDFGEINIEGNLTLEAGSAVRLLPRLNVKAAYLIFADDHDQQVQGQGLIEFAGGEYEYGPDNPLYSMDFLTIGSRQVTLGSGITFNISRKTLMGYSDSVSGGTLVLDGQLAANGGADEPLVMQLDRFENHGTFELLDGTPGQWEVGQWVNAGRLTLDVAEAALVGDWTQQANGALEVGLGGGRVGRGPSRLTVDGAMSLAGTLGLLYDEGFVAEAGDTFDILDFTTISGAFDAVDYDRSAGIAWDLAELYTTGQITAELLGDMDGDRSLDLNDVLGFVLALTDPEAYAATYGIDQDVRGDFSGDGGLSFNDINPFADALNLSASQRASLLSAVPEPSVAAMLGVCLVGVASRRRAC